MVIDVEGEKTVGFAGDVEVSGLRISIQDLCGSALNDGTQGEAVYGFDLDRGDHLGLRVHLGSIALSGARTSTLLLSCEAAGSERCVLADTTAERLQRADGMERS